MNYLFAHEINRIFIKNDLVILTELLIPFLRPFKRLLTSIFEKKILNFLTFPDPSIELVEFNFFTSIHINLLEYVSIISGQSQILKLIDYELNCRISSLWGHGRPTSLQRPYTAFYIRIYSSFLSILPEESRSKARKRARILASNSPFAKTVNATNASRNEAYLISLSSKSLKYAWQSFRSEENTSSNSSSFKVGFGL